MVSLDELYFLVRYIPFWCVPVGVISLELAYLFWIKKKLKYLSISLTIMTIAACFVLFYYIAGGPERSVRVVRELVQQIRD